MPALHQASGNARPRFEVADVFRASIDGYRQTHDLTSEQERVVRDLLACRTAVLGGHVDVCEDCGFERPSYNSCRNRHCPKCQGLAQALWLEQRKEHLLPINYFHVVFTLPAELRPLVLANRRQLFSLLFQAASETLIALGLDEKRLGAVLGFTAVLHTWTRDLRFHPHLHCIVTGGGLGPDGEWVYLPNSKYLFPLDVLFTLFRGKFLAGLKRLNAQGELNFSGGSASLADPETFRSFIDSLYRKRWNVFAKPPFASAETVYRYLGRYTHRIGIANHRILNVDPTSVRFRTRGEKTAELSHEEFIRRFLLHVLPSAFVKIRFRQFQDQAGPSAARARRCHRSCAIRARNRWRRRHRDSRSARQDPRTHRHRSDPLSPVQDRPDGLGTLSPRSTCRSRGLASSATGPHTRMTRSSTPEPAPATTPRAMPERASRPRFDHTQPVTSSRSPVYSLSPASQACFYAAAPRALQHRAPLVGPRAA
jgi:hypothetical protein